MTTAIVRYGATLQARAGRWVNLAPDDARHALVPVRRSGAPTYGTYYLRMALGRVIPSPMVDIVEDLLVLGAGLSLLRRWQRAAERNQATAHVSAMP